MINEKSEHYESHLSRVNFKFWRSGFVRGVDFVLPAAVVGLR